MSEMLQRQTGENNWEGELKTERPSSSWENANIAVAELQETVERLVKKLEPVLSPAPPVAERELDVVPAELSQLGVHVETLRQLNLRVSKLIGRVDL